MASPILEINLSAIARNWSTLNQLSKTEVETSAVVKADGYGLGATHVVNTLLKVGITKFFVATAEEGAVLRQSVQGNYDIFILSGYMQGDKDLVRNYNLFPIILSKDQFERMVNDFDKLPFALQINTGMNRLGMEKKHFLELHEKIFERKPLIVMSHLSSAENPHSSANSEQLTLFRELTSGINCQLSLAASGGILLGSDYHFDLCRPGIGLYGGINYSGIKSVINVKVPVIQVQDVSSGHGVGYDLTWVADKPTRVATIAAGYADGLIRSLSNNSFVFANTTPCPVIGRISMDLITVDVSKLADIPDYFDILSHEQSVFDLAHQAGTISHEILVALGSRYKRTYLN